VSPSLGIDSISALRRGRRPLSDAADGRLADADMEKAAADWQARQARGSLATTALNIANRSPNTLLSLFRAG